MQQKITLRLIPADAFDENQIKIKIAQFAGIKPSAISGFQLLKKSIDARGKQILFNITLNAFINEPFLHLQQEKFYFKDVRNAEKSTIIIGAGPAGLFAALKLIELGIKPIILERGKDVKSRRRDLATLNKQGIINSESNYCFGEGGAGTYSDGKLYTRSNKRGDINRILQLFVHFGAPENILADAHPHIGTNKLPQIITAMRETIISCGGEVLFNHKVIDIITNKNSISHVVTADFVEHKANNYILATGHSARDIFELLHKKNILIEAKPFALGVRVEHPQTLIDQIQYHCISRGEFLPPASYSLVEQINDKGVFSFCMCPGGIIAPASTNAEELVVNGWSPSKRNNPYANSGIVTQITQEDAFNSLKHEKIPANHPLLFMYFQKMVEHNAYKAGGGGFVAPAQRLADFCTYTHSNSLPPNSYLPGLIETNLDNVLPDFVYNALSNGLKTFGKKMKGYYTNDAIVVATESRTSSPVRIPRNSETLEHPQFDNLFPCGEGAGYAGGIVSAAMDGERVATIISHKS